MLYGIKKQSPSEYAVGYTTGVFDLFHWGHLNLLRCAKSMCGRLIVGVTTDEAAQYKGRKPVFPFQHRLDIVRSLGFVDSVVAQSNLNKYEAWKKLKFDALFVGDDWFQTDEWNVTEEKLAAEGVKTIYVPRTPDVSTTGIINKILKMSGKQNG